MKRIFRIFFVQLIFLSCIAGYSRATMIIEAVSGEFKSSNVEEILLTDHMHLFDVTYTCYGLPDTVTIENDLSSPLPVNWQDLSASATFVFFPPLHLFINQPVTYVHFYDRHIVDHDHMYNTLLSFEVIPESYFILIREYHKEDNINKFKYWRIDSRQ